MTIWDNLQMPEKTGLHDSEMQMQFQRQPVEVSIFARFVQPHIEGGYLHEADGEDLQPNPCTGPLVLDDRS